MSKLDIRRCDNKELMREFPDGYFDLVIIDPPYGVLNKKWDVAVDFKSLIIELFRISKENAAVLIFGQQPMVTDVINSCRKYFRYEIIWQKTQKTNFANAKKMPLRGHENILVFYKKLPTYNPQKYYNPSGVRKRRNSSAKNGMEYQGYSGGFKQDYLYTNEEGMMLPDSVIKFSNWNGALFGDNSNTTIHPTQKPVDLLRYLIMTYSNINDKVLDCFIGSGSTAIACHDEGRDCVGCELDPDYYEAAMKRINAHVAQQRLFV
jgi:site-specific DNA-methyltransferase (adenine-specific)